MPGEDKKGDGGDNPDAEEIKPGADGKYPETVPWNKYVGIKESLGGKLTKAEEKAKGLEEQLKNAPNKEEHDKVTQQLVDKTTELEKITTELNQGKEKTANELREALKDNKAFTEEELGKMSEAELRAAVKAAGSKKTSLPDVSGGGGGGGVVPSGSPLKVARDAYASSDKK